MIGLKTNNLIVMVTMIRRCGNVTRAIFIYQQPKFQADNPWDRGPGVPQHTYCPEKKRTNMAEMACGKRILAAKSIRLIGNRGCSGASPQRHHSSKALKEKQRKTEAPGRFSLEGFSRFVHSHTRHTLSFSSSSTWRNLRTERTLFSGCCFFSFASSPDDRTASA